MDDVGTSIVGRPRRLPADRRARPTYTLIWEEPTSDQCEYAPGRHCVTTMSVLIGVVGSCICDGTGILDRALSVARASAGLLGQPSALLAQHDH